MALKDWKKTNDDEIGFDYSNSSRGLQISYRNRSKVLQVSHRAGYKYDEIVISKKFKTKSQAFKYAKAYMKNH